MVEEATCSVSGIGEGFMESMAFELGRLLKAWCGESHLRKDENGTVPRGTAHRQKTLGTHVGLAGQARSLYYSLGHMKGNRSPHEFTLCFAIREILLKM